MTIVVELAAATVAGLVIASRMRFGDAMCIWNIWIWDDKWMIWVCEKTWRYMALLIFQWFPWHLAQVLVTAIVERLGPVVGGVLGCVPHVAVVGSVGFILQTASSDEFRIAMLSMPLGMLCNSFLSEKGVTPGHAKII